MVQIETQRCKMVRILPAGPVWAYEMYDVVGRHLGSVVNPAGPPRVGRGAGTVLLDRSPKERSGTR